MADDILRSYRAAQRYHYNVEALGDKTYLVTNPTTGSKRTVTIDDLTTDRCECEVFSQGNGTCIHIEHVRLRLGLPSPSLRLAEGRAFAYAWFDKATLPPRIRVGFVGAIESSVRRALRGITVISDASVLDAVKNRVQEHGIAFHVLLSAKIALAVPERSQCDSRLTDIILQKGRAFLAKTLPQLRHYQISGAMFLASVQCVRSCSTKWGWGRPYRQ